MPSTEAISIAPRARAWLGGTAKPRILQLFDQACNLVNEHNDVLSVVTREIGEGPFNLVVNDLPELPWTSKASIASDQLVVDDLTVEFQSAQPWNPRPEWEKLHAAIDNVISQTAGVEVQAPHLPRALIAEMAAAMAAANESDAARVGVALAGLGPGLTPAGDDFLMGAMHAVWILHPVDVAAALCRELIEAALPRTTTLSGAWLRAAAAGEAGVRWHRLFEAVIAVQPVQVSSAIESILATGETSGADALSGFIQVLGHPRPT